MTALATVLVAGVLALYFWREVKPFIDRALKAREAKVQSEVEAAKPVPPPEPTKREALPATLVTIANEWRDPWAREQAMDAYCELYDATRNWDTVVTVALSEQARYLQTKNQLS